MISREIVIAAPNLTVGVDGHTVLTGIATASPVVLETRSCSFIRRRQRGGSLGGMCRPKGHGLEGAVRHKEVCRLIDLNLCSLGVSTTAATTTVSVMHGSGRRRSTSASYPLGVGQFLLLMLRARLMMAVVLMMVLLLVV